MLRHFLTLKPLYSNHSVNTADAHMNLTKKLFKINAEQIQPFLCTYSIR